MKLWMKGMGAKPAALSRSGVLSVVQLAWNYPLAPSAQFATGAGCNAAWLKRRVCARDAGAGNRHRGAYKKFSSVICEICAESRNEASSAAWREVRLEMA